MAAVVPTPTSWTGGVREGVRTACKVDSGVQLRLAADAGVGAAASPIYTSTNSWLTVSALSPTAGGVVPEAAAVTASSVSTCSLFPDKCIAC